MAAVARRLISRWWWPWLGEVPTGRPKGFRFDGAPAAYVAKVCGGETLGDPNAEAGADLEVLLGGGSIEAIAEPSMVPF